MKRILPQGLPAAAAILLAALGPAELEGQTTFTACRVPDVGAIYMIGVSGAPSACLDDTHIQFSWTEGGATSDVSCAGCVDETDIADGAVSGIKIAASTITSGDIADGTIGSADIGDGTVSAADLAPDAVNGGTILDGAVTSADIADGTIASVDVQDNSLTHADLAPLAAGGMGSIDLGNALGIGTTATNLGSITITVPTSGEVYVALSGYAVVFGDNTVVQVGLGSAAGLLDLHEVQVGRLDGSGTNRFEYAFNPMTVVSVTGGSTTFYATAVKPSVFSTNSVNLVNLRLIVIWIPE